jgi:hypothetical protein
MATPEGTRAQRFPLKSGDAVHIYSNAQAITRQLRREVPVLSPSDAIAIAGELLTTAAAQLKAQ